MYRAINATVAGSMPSTAATASASSLKVAIRPLFHLSKARMELTVNPHLRKPQMVPVYADQEIDRIAGRLSVNSPWLHPFE
jgi:hypothetical protein